MIPRLAIRLAVPVLGLAPLVAQKAPTTYELDKKLIPAFLAEDGRSTESRARQLEILAQVERVTPLRGSSEKTWRKKLAKAWQKGRRLPTDGDKQHFFEPEKKGLYFVGGQTRRPKGLLIAMHAGGTGSGSVEGTHGWIDPAAKKLGWLSICPDMLEPSERGWTEAGTDRLIVDLIDAARRTWRIEPDRVYLTGRSRGGYGSWTLGAQHADRIAAIAAWAGAPTPIRESGGDRLVGIVEGVIPSLRNLFVVCFQAADDPFNAPESTRFAMQQLAEAHKRWGGFEHEYWEVAKNGGNPPPGGIDALLAKIAKRTRAPRPKKVVWQPVLDWKRQFYWLHWERPRANAIVEAECDPGGNEVRVTCEGDTAGLSVLLDADMFDVKKDLVVKLGDQVVFRGKPEPTLATLLLTARDGDPGRLFAYRVPLDGKR